MKGSDRTRKLWVAWLAVGVTEVFPSLLSYFKAWGYWNNLIIIDLWASLPVLAVLLHTFNVAREKGAIEVRAVAGGALGIFLVSLVPTRYPATHLQYEFGRALDAAVAADVRDGKRVLVSHGAATLVHAGALAVPLDRAISISELGNANMVGAMSKTSERIAAKRYDKIYLVLGYAPEVQATIDANYHQTGHIPSDNWHEGSESAGRPVVHGRRRPDSGAESMKRSGLEWTLLATAAALAVGIVAVEVPRVIFPWDLLMFSETSVLTDLMKINAGQSIYTSPADCNSMIYAPGFDYLAFGVLRPFGAQLDIRACRLVCVLIGVAAALVAGGIGARLGAMLRGDKRVDRVAVAIAAVLAGGIIFTSYTADGCHPDNLWVLHAMVVIALTHATVASSRYRLALVTIAVASIGFLVKQTAGLGVIGSGAVLVYFCRRRWGAGRTAALAGWGALWIAGAAYFLLHGWGRWWTTTLVSQQPFEWWRRYWLIEHYTGEFPYRTLLVLAFPPSAIFVAMRARKDEALRKLSAAWLAVGVTEVLPCLAAYFKAWAFWNNLTIFDVWMGVPVFGAMWLALRGSEDDGPPAIVRSLAGGLVGLQLVSLVPTHMWPLHEHYAFGRALDAGVAADGRAGKRVLVSGGDRVARACRACRATARSNGNRGRSGDGRLRRSPRDEVTGRAALLRENLRARQRAVRRRRSSRDRRELSRGRAHPGRALSFRRALGPHERDAFHEGRSSHHGGESVSTIIAASVSPPFAAAVVCR